MRELSLFTGAGGGLLGTHLLGFEACGYVEWNKYCQQVIAARINDGFLPVAPIFTDVREFVQSGAARQYRGIADVVSAGFPCQPYSATGKQQGHKSPKDMWPATRAVIREVMPKVAWLENVPRLISLGYLSVVLKDLAALGFDAKWGVLSAASAGAEHVRERLWICANANGSQPQRGELPSGAYQEHSNVGSGRGWQAKSSMDRVAYGMANQLDRLEAIGNGQVPIVVKNAWELLA